MDAMKTRHVIWIVMALLAIDGCSLQSVPPGEAAAEGSLTGGLRSSHSVEKVQGLPSAALVLARDADHAAAQHLWDAAARDLERALDIAPQSALLWQRMAAVRFSQGRYHQVEALAHKSNLLAGDDTAMRRINWRMIAAARAALGDHQGAEEAIHHAIDIGH